MPKILITKLFGIPLLLLDYKSFSGYLEVAAFILVIYMFACALDSAFLRCGEENASDL